MSLFSGTKLAQYEIVELIGKGGMGEVYRARDGKLRRDVAIKVLPDEFARDEERRRRFQREATLLASLNHPNIAAIYGLEQSGGTHYLVLELVPGETLAERIARGRIPVDEALEIAAQIAEALEEAHERGIVHRDLKPANIKITEDGKIKVLDFGLAKALVQNDAEGDVATSTSPTVTRDGTRLGIILGTAAYMSPEQAKGKKVDRRADVWAFGAVLYEMLAGKRAFDGEDVSDTLACILTREPDWEALPAATPAAARQALRYCLTKNLKHRIRDIADVRLAMAAVFGTAPSSASSERRISRAAIGTALILGGVLTGVAVWKWKPPPPRPLARFVLNAPSEALDGSSSVVDVAITPDGARIVYSATVDGPQLVMRALDQLEATVLGGLGRSPRGPFLSPDGNWVGYFGDGLEKVSILGGPPVTICGVPNQFSGGASWGPDDTIVFATVGPGGLWRVPAGGGEPEELTTPDRGEDHLWPEILPGGEAVLFTITSGSVEPAQIAVLSLATGERKGLLPGGSNPRYAASGHIVYGVEGTLRAVGFDLERLEVTSDSVPVLDGVDTNSSAAASFAVSASGSLVYKADTASAVGRTLVWVDREGRETPIPAEPRAYFYPRVSPDGTRVALDVRDEEQDIWIWDFARETLNRLTFGPPIETYPVWTPDGLRVAFGSYRDGGTALFWKGSDGTGAVERLDSADNRYPHAFSPSGTILVYREVTSAKGTDLGVLSMDGSERVSAPLIATKFDETNPEISPDGRWLAYQSDESGQYEIYVRPFPDVDSGRWQVSRGGGTRPLWARNGRELFFLSQKGQLTAVPVRGGPNFSTGNSEVVIEQTYSGGIFGRTYDISPDGKRFLMIKEGSQGDDTTPTQLILVQNWFEELERLVPAGK